MKKIPNTFKNIFFILLTLAVTNSFAANDENPYQVIDGKIDENTMQGWRSFRGGTCGMCHGGAGQGGAGPNLTLSLGEKIDKAKFIETVTNGRSGTLMRPFKKNNRVMENIDHIYAYLKARSDGVLGPENLIKFPLGKK
jgi:mono/diheme cytochrome c family protein